MSQNPIVTVEQGKLKGKIEIDIRGGQYFSFQGIPYAKPPLGELRFKAPQPPEPWTDVRDATKEGSDCFSRNMVTQQLNGSEDCLFLNVYTPQLASGDASPIPVMVWIHGGGFTTGSGSTELYGPEFLVPEGVVLVTINYRLGYLGLLSLEDDSLEVPGNASLKDQVMALKWVQRNISNFGGDPNNVTIFGESAGGACVHYLMLSPMAKGLFHRAIAQSGSALSCWAGGQRSVPLISKALGLETVSEKEILKILKEMHVEKLFEIQEKLSNSISLDKRRPYGAVIESTTRESAFLSEDPTNIIKSGKFNNVPLMIGFTSREGMLAELISTRDGETKIVVDFEKTIPFTLNLTGDEDRRKAAEKIKHFYYGDGEPTLENMDQYYLLQSDNFFVYPIYTTIKHHTAVSSTPVYLYRMSVECSLNVYKTLIKARNPGTCHGDDVGYLFKTIITPSEIRPGSIEDQTVRRCVKLWTTFARNGDPNPLEKDPLINVTWKAVEKDELHFLNIGENLTVGVNPEAGRMAFWNKIDNSKQVL